MDAAYENATKRRRELEAEVSDLTARLSKARAEINRVDDFLRVWADFAGVNLDGLSPNATPLEPLAASSEPVAAKSKRVRPANPPKEKVGDEVEVILRENNGPMSRRELFESLAERGIILDGSDPQMVLSTMLWRMGDRFERLPRVGYWLKGVPNPTDGPSIFNDET